MNISGKTRLMGVLGQGIKYTLSPAIHNFSARRLGIDIVYVPFDMKQIDMKHTFDLFWEMGVVGFNVTTPYKTAVGSLLGSGLEASVNTVYRKDGGWAAASTDAQGLDHAIARTGLALRGFRRIIILGAGGVVSALLAYIAKSFDHFPEVSVLRRQKGHDAALVDRLPPSFNIHFYDFDPQIFNDLLVGAAGETLVIQATNAPVHGDDLKRFSGSVERFTGAFIDLVYGTPSAMFRSALDRGIPCQDGLPMLIEQARLAQKYWWNDAASYDDIYNHLITIDPRLAQHRTSE